MIPKFVDTGFYVAFFNPHDSLHARSLEIAASTTEKLITTEYVLVELSNFFSKQPIRNNFKRICNQILHDPETTIIPSDSTLFQSGLDLFFARPDKGWSLTDCISFVVMTDRGLTEALTADHHFEQAGFVALLK